MHIGFLNPQGNFDRHDSYWTEHPDFGGQLIYVKNVAVEMAKHGHKVDIITRQINDPEWSEFSEKFDGYPDAPNVRIIRLPAGPKEFLRKELLWSHLVRDWIPNILEFYQEEGNFPDVMTGHYADGGISGILIEAKVGVPFTFTAHSLGALKMDKLEITPENISEMDEYYHFGRRLMAERLSMNRSAVNITSTTAQERFKQYAHPAYHWAVDVNNDARFAEIPPGVDPSLFDIETRSPNEEETYQLIQERLGRDIDERRQNLPAIIAASRLAPKKNHLGLVQAFAESKTLQEQANLVIFTQGEDNPLREPVSDETAEQEVLIPLRDVVNTNNLWSKISAFGVPDQPALAAAYRFFAQRHSVFALTSHHEPFGLGPIEAALAGLPLVVTQNSGLMESLREGDQVYGILIDPENPEAIAKGLEEVLSDYQQWERLHQDCRQHVLKYYTWERAAIDYLKLIEEIVASPNARRADELLPIHPYFLDPRPENDVSLDELKELYFQT
ncbi:MAG: glycosyltransferase [Coleofasciculus sp. G3-WIS-01]|uniref:glycosyltransferase n=1 Tax=Coleofasciculus sp. G3-WIS-01 TaxID=3069528 RepID=UPI0032F855B9